MLKNSIFWRDLKIVTREVWLNLVLFLVLLSCAAILLRFSGAYPQASWLDLLIKALHMAELEPVTEPGDGTIPGLLTILVPLSSVIILGEGVLRVLTVFIARGEHREEWNIMVAKNYTDHIVVCGMGELGRALVKRISADHPKTRIVLVDLHPGILAETGLSEENIVYIQSDMTNIETLKKANCHKAKLVLLAAGNDAFNLEAAYKILQLNPNTEIWVRLHHAGLADLMDFARKPNLHFFSPYQQAADTIIQDIWGTSK
jgi:hypothetical protein